MTDCKSVTFWESDFGVVKITGDLKTPMVKPDYMKQRRVYLDWRREEGARAMMANALDKLSEAVWILGGSLEEVKVAKKGKG